MMVSLSNVPCVSISNTAICNNNKCTPKIKGIFHGTYLAGHGTFKLTMVGYGMYHAWPWCGNSTLKLYNKLLAKINCGKLLFIMWWLLMLHPTACTVLRWRWFVTLDILWVEKHRFKVRASTIVCLWAIQHFC